MVYRITLRAAALISCLFLSVATAASPRHLMRPSLDRRMGTNVEPSAAVQKQNEGRSVSGMAKDERSSFIGSALAAGAPGVEGAPGTESGR